MQEKSDVFVCLKRYLSEEDARKINELQDVCNSYESVNLKLEIDFKLFIKAKYEKSLSDINEFLYYINDELIGYLGVCSFGKGIAEINGMVHPEYRRRGIFKKLYELAIDECGKREFDSILLLSDAKSDSGINFIKSTGAEYAFSECRMRLSEESKGNNAKSIILRKALDSEKREISRQNSICFGIEDNNSEEAEEEDNRITYMIELEDKVIGKIKVSMEDGAGFISGFAVLPEFRGKGFGREALSQIIQMLVENNITDISLDVETKNMNALNLYKSCGFKEESIMNYYKV